MTILRLPLPRSIGARAGTDEYPDSPQFRDGGFHNRQPMQLVEGASRASLAREFVTEGKRGNPTKQIPVVRPELPAQAAGCAATWLGHATVLLEVGGHYVLTDPVWSNRVSPASRIGPKRFHPVPMTMAELPRLSAVLISHDHYDHLDTASIDWLNRNTDVAFVVPLGVGGHLRSWGVPAGRIHELDWNQTYQQGELRLTCTEARHFSGRLFTNNTTLWSSWVIAAGAEDDERRVFFGGDSGYTPAFTEIGADYGPFELTVMPIGAYDARWRDVHLDPAEAVQAHLDVNGEVLLPIHWATFNLAFHPWSAPIEWLTEVAEERDVTIACPRPGERFAVGGPLPVGAWWQDQESPAAASRST